MFAPVGVAVTVVEDLPELIAKGRRRVELELGNARVVGRFVVHKGQREVSGRLDEILGNGTDEAHRRRRRGGGAAGSAHRRRPAPDPAAEAIVGGALADYDTLSASQVVRRLESLGPDELRAVQRYEASTRNRRTILNRADQLLGRAADAAAVLAAVELARPAGAADRQACTRLLSQALVSAASMRGGAALVGDATPVTLLERWTRPGGAAHLLVGEYEGAVVGLLAVDGRHAGSRPAQRADRVLLRRDRSPRRRGGHGPHGGRRRVVHGVGLHGRRRPGAPGRPLDQAAPRGGGLHRPSADPQPPVGLKRRSVLTRRGGGGGMRSPSSLARAGTEPAAWRAACGPPRRRGCRPA